MSFTYEPIASQSLRSQIIYNYGLNQYEDRLMQQRF